MSDLNSLLAEAFAWLVMVGVVVAAGMIARAKAKEAADSDRMANYWQRMFLALKNGQPLEEVEP